MTEFISRVGGFLFYFWLNLIFSFYFISVEFALKFYTRVHVLYLLLICSCWKVLSYIFILDFFVHRSPTRLEEFYLLHYVSARTHRGKQSESLATMRCVRQEGLDERKPLKFLPLYKRGIRWTCDTKESLQCLRGVSDLWNTLYYQVPLRREQNREQ